MRETGIIRSFMTVILLFSSLFCKIAAAQELSLEPPANFILSIENDQSTYKDAVSGAIIQLVPINDKGLAHFIADFSTEQLIKNGLSSISSDTVYINQIMTAVWFKGWFDLSAADNSGTITRYTRIIWFTGDANTTIMAVATFPTIGDGVLVEPLLESFLTIKW